MSTEARRSAQRRVDGASAATGACDAEVAGAVAGQVDDVAVRPCRAAPPRAAAGPVGPAVPGHEEDRARLLLIDRVGRRRAVEPSRDERGGSDDDRERERDDRRGRSDAEPEQIRRASVQSPSRCGGPTQRASRSRRV